MEICSAHLLKYISGFFVENSCRLKIIDMKEVEIKEQIELTIRFGEDVKRFIEPMSFSEFLKYTSEYRFIRIANLDYAVNVNNIEKVKIIDAD